MKVFLPLAVIASICVSSDVRAQSALIHPTLSATVVLEAGKRSVLAFNPDSTSYQDSLSREVAIWKGFRPSRNMRLEGQGVILNAYQQDSGIAIPNAYRGDESIEIPNAASEFRILTLPVK